MPILPYAVTDRSVLRRPPMPKNSLRQTRIVLARSSRRSLLRSVDAPGRPPTASDSSSPGPSSPNRTGLEERASRYANRNAAMAEA